MIQVYHRKRKAYVWEEQYGQKALQFMYHTIIGRVFLKLAIHPIFSKINGWYNQSPLSRSKIKRLIKQYRIDLSEYEKKSYGSFNAFFIRKKKSEHLQCNPSTDAVISPADGKMMVYEISDHLQLFIKSSSYNLNALLQNKGLAQRFKGGICLVYRLSLDDYHRYCYVADGRTQKEVVIPGRLHTVSSISAQYKVFSENTRHYQVIHSPEFKKVVQMEIGAMLVGKINNNQGEMATKGLEKGFFAFGGSTIVVLYEKGTVIIDSDILEQSHNGFETKVSYGEVIGKAI